MNDCKFVGRLTKDPEIKSISGDKIIATINVAVTRKFRDKSTGERESDYVFIKAFGHAANYARKYLKIGDLVGVQCVFQKNNYEKDGQKVYRNDFIADSIQKYVSSSKSKESDNKPEGETKEFKDSINQVDEAYAALAKPLEETVPF